MRILVRTSKWAIWARRLATFALPLVIVPVFMHRERMVSTDAFQVIEGVAVAIALLALVLAVGAFVRLWITGDQGWGRAATGLIFSLICLAPAAYGAVLLVRYPATTDVSTDLGNRPVLTSGVPGRRMTPDLVAQVAAAFPNAANRTYPLGPQEVFALADALASARGWDVRLRREPQTPLDEGQLNAIVTTLLGWRDEVSIRINGVPEGSTVAMRSASLTGIHDLGTNGQRIEEYLLALDTEITVLMRDMPVTAPLEEEAPAEVEDAG